MADRKAELERKRAKLNALREEKERKKKEKENAGSVGDAGPASLNEDEYWKSLGIEPPSVVMSSLNSLQGDSVSITSLPDTGISGPGSASLVDGGIKLEDFQKRRAKLTVTQVTQTNIPAQEKVSYTKETQTAQSGSDHRDSYYDMWLKPRKAHAFDYYDEYNLNPGLEWDDEFAVLTFDDGQAEDEESSLSMDQRLPKLPPGILKSGMPEVTDVAPAVTELEKVKIEEEHKATMKPKDLSEEEKQMIILSPNFQKFLDKSARIMERALTEQHTDIFIDYAKSADTDEEKEEKSSTRLSLNRCFYDDKWTKNRCITCLDWSAQYPELLAASYSRNEDAPHDPDGVCLIWNTKFMKTTPEYIFHCQSPVTSTAFARFHPNLVLGGTYSGSIVVWDNRVDKRTPIQRSPLTTSAHTHPVYCLKVVGTQNSHNVISISTDGKMCSWSLDMLAQPQETLDLQHKQGKAVAPTCLAFPHGSVNNFVIGSEEGMVYSACRHGTKTGVTESFEGHHAPVTGIHHHDVQGPVDFSYLYLTSSFDWSVKLWSLKEPRPLYSFEVTGDYVYDVAWSPIHPSVFASVDGAGKLDLWNLNNDTELPTTSVTVDGPVALNRVSWTQSGLHVVAGDDVGKIWVYDVGEQLANPRTDDWQRFARTLADLKYNQGGEDLDQMSINSREFTSNKSL